MPTSIYFHRRRTRVLRLEESSESAVAMPELSSHTKIYSRRKRSVAMQRRALRHLRSQCPCAVQTDWCQTSLLLCLLHQIKGQHLIELKMMVFDRNKHRRNRYCTCPSNDCGTASSGASCGFTRGDNPGVPSGGIAKPPWLVAPNPGSCNTIGLLLSP